MNKWHANRYGNWWEQDQWRQNWHPDSCSTPPPGKNELRFIRDGSGRFTYYLRDDATACLVDFHGSRDHTMLIVPAAVDGHAVTGINWAHCSDFSDAPYDFDPHTVVLPDTVREIGDFAFSGFPRLQSVYLPAHLESIGTYAFAGCGIEKILLPDSLRHIGNSAFEHCRCLTEIALPPQLPYIASGLFRGCSALVRISLPESITSIESCAFLGCESLCSIRLPGDLESIADYAFSGCTGLMDVTLPPFLRSISVEAFARCTSLSALYIPRSVRSISYNAFKACPNLTITAEFGSYAEAFSLRNKIPCTLP